MDIYRLLCALTMGGLACLAMLLIFLRVPMQREWDSFRKAKLFTALACVVLSAAYGSSALMGWTFGVPVLLVWFVVAALQALLLTFTCVVFVAPQTPMRRLILWNLIPIAALTLLLSSAYLAASRWSQTLLMAGVACYLLQLAFYTRYFINIYRANVYRLEEVFDDDLAPRLRWVKQLFFSALAVGLLAVAVILLTDQTLDTAFALVVAAYYTYVTISFINYMPRAAFVVKAAIEEAKAQASLEPSERGQSRPQVREACLTEAPTEGTTTADHLDHVREAVDRWVADKHYLESDVSIDEIARQMGISRQELNDYFAKVLQLPFRSWRIEQRIREAERILAADPAITTSELYARCGYNDRSNFHKHFTKVTGRSLADYREEA